MHFSDDSTMDFEDLDRAMMIDRRYEPVSPDWFIEEVRDHRGDSDDADEAEAERKKQAEASATTHIIREIKAKRYKDLSRI